MIVERKMQTTHLGNSDLKVSKICLGTMTFGEQNTEAEAHSQLDYALERGINFIDTAEMYPVMPRAETQEKLNNTSAAGSKNPANAATLFSPPKSRVRPVACNGYGKVRMI
jgi:diketogulonate reductase-like aldo/keto reductase